MRRNIVTILVAVVLIGTFCIASTFFLGLNGLSIRLGDAIVSSEIRMETVVPTPQRVRINTPEPPICEFVDGVTEDGLEVSAAATVIGPTIVQLDPERIVVIYPKKNYTVQQGAIIWLYKGNLDCLLAQLEFFPGKEVTFVK